MSKSTIQVLVLTLIIVVALVGLELYHKSKEITLPNIVEEQLKPMDPNLPTQILDQLEQKSANSSVKDLPTLPF